MKNVDGFFKISQEFRGDVKNGKYFPILDKLNEVASKNQNNLPYYFCLEDLFGFTAEDVSYVLKQLYPNRKYSCKLSDGNIFCVRE